MAMLEARWRATGTLAGAWVRRASYLEKWVVLGVAIGVIAGLGAVLFYLALDLATRLLLGDLGGYHAPTPFGEGNGLGSGHFDRWWAIPLVVALGGIVSGVLVFTFAPEAEGHGTDAAIDAVHKNPRAIRIRAVVVKIVASAVTIGSGGSGGREGPTAQISAGFGSFLARWLDLSPEDGRVAVSVGIGSGIGAIFGAPLGGAVLAADIVYSDDIEVAALIPGLISSIVAYTVFGAFEGFDPLFGYASPGYEFHQPVQLLWFAIIGIIAGFVGILYSDGFYGTIRFVHRIPGSRMWKPAAGGLLVGLLALAIPQVLGTGYGWIQHSLDRPELLSLPLWIVLVLPLARIVATSLSIGSGGSGGIFGPGMVIGAFVGAAVWRLLEPFAPGIPHSPAPFVIVGMMACFGSIARAPLAVMLMVAEMTGSLTILAPAMVAVGLAYLIVRRSGRTIYASQLANRDEARAARLLAGLPLLAGIPVRSAMQPPQVTLAADTTVADALARLRDAGVPGAPVTGPDGVLLGSVSLEDLDGRGDGDAGMPVSRLADTTAPTVQVDADLGVAVDALAETQRWLPVVDDTRRVQGVLGLADLVTAYRGAVREQARSLERLPSRPGADEVEVGAAADGRSLAQLRLPGDVIVVSVRRGDDNVPVSGATTLRTGDVLTVLAHPDRLTGVRARFAGTEDADRADGPRDGRRGRRARGDRAGTMG